MTPLRTVAEAMGFTVVWNEDEQSIFLKHSDGEIFSRIVLGQDSFEGHQLGAMPTIHNGRAYVPVSLFEILFLR